MFCFQLSGDPTRLQRLTPHLDSLGRLIVDLAVSDHEVDLVCVPGGELHLDRVHHGESDEPEVQDAVYGLVGVGRPLESGCCRPLLVSTTNVKIQKVSDVLKIASMSSSG